MRKNLVLAGYTAIPKDGKAGLHFFSTDRTRMFLFQRTLNSRIEAYKYRKNLFDGGHYATGASIPFWNVFMEQGRTDGNTTYVLVNRDPRMSEDDFTFAIHHECLPFFGKPNAFIFDWSGVLSNDGFKGGPVHSAVLKTMAKYGIAEIPYHDIFENAVYPVSAFLSRHGDTADPREVNRSYAQLYAAEVARGNKPQMNPDAGFVLERLAKEGKRLAVMSAHPLERLRHELKDYGLEDYFIPHIAGDVFDKREGLLRMAARLGEKPHDCVYITDMAQDIIAARLAGVHAVGVIDGYNSIGKLRSAEPGFVLDSLVDALAIRPVDGGGIELSEFAKRSTRLEMSGSGALKGSFVPGSGFDYRE